MFVQLNINYLIYLINLKYDYTYKNIDVFIMLNTNSY